MTAPARNRYGALLGKIAQGTRSLILQSLKDDIDSGVPWRKLSAKDAAQAAGRTSATFWGIWPDIETAVIELARELLQSKIPLSEHFKQIILLLGMEGYDVPQLPEEEK